jgi:hypothetical protein
MSAYALPGLFPPLTFETSNYSICDSTRTSEEEKFSSRTLKCYPNNSNNAQISFKQAKIDAYELIHCLTNHSQESKSKKRVRLRRQYSPPYEAPVVGNPQDAALLFEIEVSFDERQFIITRNLRRFRELRNDLIEEQSCCVPDFPEFSESSRAQSFCLLQDMLKSYAPAVEIWLCKILEMFPIHESPALKIFLLEPTGFDGDRNYLTNTPASPNLDSTRRTVTRLESINEDDKEEKADEDD